LVVSQLKSPAGHQGHENRESHSDYGDEYCDSISANGETELALIRESGWQAFPPRLPEQPIFYPVLDEEYAIQIARDWNTRDGGQGFVLRFQINRDYLSRFQVQTVGARIHRECWIPAEDLPEFNRNIVGTIDVIHHFESRA